MIAVIAIAFIMYGALAANWSNLITAPYRIEAMAVIAILTLSWLAFRTLRRWIWYRTMLDKVLVLWIIAFAVSLLANTEVWRRIVIGLWFSGLYVILWYMLHDCILNGLLKREAIIDGTLLAGAAVLAVGYNEFVKWAQAGAHGTLPVMLSTLDNPNPLGTVVLILLCLALCRTLMTRGLLRIGLGIYTLLAAGALFLTFSRGAWLGGGVGVVVFALLYLLLRKVRFNWPVVIGLVAVTGLVGIGVTLYRGWGDNGRLPIYEAAFQMFREKPLTGYGLYTFGRGLLRIVGVIPATTTHAHAHNLILNIAAELGIIGLIAFTITVIVFVRALRDNWINAQNGRHILLAGAIAAVAGVGVHHLFDVTALLPAVAIIGMVPLIVAMTPSLPEPMLVPRLRFALVSTLALIILVAGAWDNYVYNQYYSAITYAMQVFDARGTLDKLQPAVDNDPNIPVYHLMQAYFLQYVDAPQAEDAAFEAVCKLEPDYAAAPYDGQEAILQYLRLSLLTPQSFWDKHSCKSTTLSP